MFRQNIHHTGVTSEVVVPPLIKIWNYTTGGSVNSSPAVSGGVVYVGSDAGDLYALDAKTGAKVWSYSTGNMYNGWISSPAVVDGIVCIGCVDLNVYAFKHWDPLLP